MKSSIYIFLAVSAFTLGGCTGYQEGARNLGGALGAIDTHDLNQAEILRDWLSQEPKIKGRFSVEAKPQEIVTTFKDDLPEGKTPVFKERMAQLKIAMQNDLGKPINTLVFIFPSQTIQL